MPFFSYLLILCHTQISFFIYHYAFLHAINRVGENLLLARWAPVSFADNLPLGAHAHIKPRIFRGFCFKKYFYNDTATFGFKLSGSSASSIEMLAIILKPYVSLMRSSFVKTSSTLSVSTHEIFKKPSRYKHSKS